MSEYWVEIHPESPSYITLCNGFLDIMKKAGFNIELDSQILSAGKTFTIIIYRNEYNAKIKSRLVGNKVTNIDYTNISKIYKNPVKIPLVFEQENKDFGTDFDVFVIDFLSETKVKKENETEDLGDIFI